MLLFTHHSLYVFLPAMQHVHLANDVLQRHTSSVHCVTLVIKSWAVKLACVAARQAAACQGKQAKATGS